MDSRMFLTESQISNFPCKKEKEDLVKWALIPLGSSNQTFSTLSCLLLWTWGIWVWDPIYIPAIWADDKLW